MTVQAVARVGDTGSGICTLHGVTPVAYTVTFTTGSPIGTLDGAAICVVGSQGLATCGHTTTALTGSATCTLGGLAIHRVGDTGTTGGGSYTVITGSPTWSMI